MSDPRFKIIQMPDGHFEVEMDIETTDAMAETIKMDYESGKDPKYPPYNCQIGYHNWVWYEGLGLMERFWFCSECDKKDMDRKPPPPKRSK